MNNIHEPQFIEHLFDKMSSSYTKMNYISSFGFSERWRKQFIKELNIKKGKTIIDLMTGKGECWKHIPYKSNKNSILIGVDFSTQMILDAKKTKSKYPYCNIKLLKENVFSNSIQDQSADYVISGFGLKTLSIKQIEQLASEIYRILKPGGTFSLIDISVPNHKTLRFLYLFYLKTIIPQLGKLFLGNPDTYKMLGIYTEHFTNAQKAYLVFNKPEFESQYFEYFYGCASGIKGKKNK